MLNMVAILGRTIVFLDLSEVDASNFVLDVSTMLLRTSFLDLVSRFYLTWTNWLYRFSLSLVSTLLIRQQSSMMDLRSDCRSPWISRVLTSVLYSSRILRNVKNEHLMRSYLEQFSCQQFSLLSSWEQASLSSCKPSSQPSSYIRNNGRLSKWARQNFYNFFLLSQSRPLNIQTTEALVLSVLLTSSLKYWSVRHYGLGKLACSFVPAYAAALELILLLRIRWVEEEMLGCKCICGDVSVLNIITLHVRPNMLCIAIRYPYSIHLSNIVQRSGGEETTQLVSGIAWVSLPVVVAADMVVLLS